LIAERHGHWIHWASHGPREAGGPGDPVLMIMGLSGSSRAWWRLLPHVSARHRAIVFDHRGTGDSDRIGRPLTMDDLVDDALAVLDAAEVERAHVIGVSMGGMIAQHLALDHRARVRSLTLGCTTPGRSGGPPWRLLATVALRPVLGPARTFPLVAPALFSEHTRTRSPERVAEDLEVRLAEATPVRTTLAQMAAVARHDTRPRLHELAGLPTLVLHGSDDALVPPESGRELGRAIPGARLVELERCGHVMTTDAEEPTAQAILEHLRRAAARAAAEGTLNVPNSRSAW
jgi:3-oxoadipate enol-lactonase